MTPLQKKNPTPGHTARGSEISMQRDMTPVFITTPLRKAKTRRQPKSPPCDDWIPQGQRPYTIGHNTAFRKKEEVFILK